MRKSFLALPAFAALALAGCSQAATSSASSPATHTSASASPSPSPSGSGSGGSALLDANNTAGWYTMSLSATLTQVAGTFRLSAADLATHGALGLELCNSKTGYAVQFGAVPETSGWRVGYFTGTLSPAAGIGGDPCAGNWFLRSSTVTTLGSVPAGALLHAQITEQADGELTLTYADSAVTSFTHRVQATPGHFNQAAAAASYAGVIFRGPVVNEITDFTGVTATSASGVTGGLAAWGAVRVSGSETGQPPTLITASRLSPATGQGPSSFAIIGATPKL
jgi:hypothetical protein